MKLSAEQRFKELGYTKTIDKDNNIVYKHKLQPNIIFYRKNGEITVFTTVTDALFVAILTQKDELGYYYGDILYSMGDFNE